MRTGPVKALVHEVLNALPQPYTEHVIDDVFFAIETSQIWRAAYESLCSTLGKDVVNSRGGYWVANALDKAASTKLQAPSRKSTLIASYSLLDTDAKIVVKKPKEAEARQLMWTYYQGHKLELPSDIRKDREAIVELIMEGMPTAEAFSSVREAAL